MTKFHDSRIETRIEKNIKDRFTEIARVNHMTPSELSRLLIVQYVQGKLELKPVAIK